MKRWMIPAAVVLGVALLAGVGYLGFSSNRPQKEPIVVAPNTVAAARCNVEQTASAPGSAVLTRIEGLQMPAEGRLAEILAYTGQKVKQGQVLARLADAEKYQAAAAEAELARVEAQRQLQEVSEQAPVRSNQARAALLDAQKKLDQAKAQQLSKSNKRATKDSVDMARAKVTLAADAMDRANELYDQLVNRDDKDPEKAMALNQAAAARQEYTRLKASLDWLLSGISDFEIAQADNAIALAQASVTAAERAWERVKDGPDALLLKQAQAKVDQANARLKEAQQVLENLEIRAPFDGTVTEIKVHPGETLPNGTALFTMIDPAAIEVNATVTEEDLLLLHEGMAVNLFFDALPDMTVTGKIKSIIPRRVGGDSPHYTVRVVLDAVPAGLAEGMSVDASIVLARREGVLCLARGVVRASADGKASVQVWNGLASEKRTLSVGLVGDKDVEILAGIREGEKVVVK
jgi:HlyD family secretion protein